MRGGGGGGCMYGCGGEGEGVVCGGSVCVGGGGGLCVLVFAFVRVFFVCLRDDWECVIVCVCYVYILCVYVI